MRADEGVLGPGGLIPHDGRHHPRSAF
eukprot:COSAG01_NODE_15123_length_1372_cov_1.706991_2_plen_26_part_01